MSNQAAKANILLLLRSRALEAWQTTTLIEWSEHADAEVRDWATFALASRDEDGADVREALLNRLADEDLDVRSEALWGLARRGDGRAVEPLRQALAADTVGELMIEAAGLFARGEFVPLLEELKERPRVNEGLLQDAIRRCSGKPTPGRLWDSLAGDQPT